MRLCVFQGTFNPIHKIHLKIANFAKIHYGFDSVLFIPAYIPPHKSIDKSLADHRFNMVKLAISEYSYFKISDIEYKSEQNSYTYNTIVELYKRYDVTGKINFLIGTDAFMKIESWYKAESLKDLVHFIVFKRTDEFKESDFDFLKEKGYDFEFSPMDYYNVSSTALRNSLRLGQSISDEELPKVKEYIKEHGLYLKTEIINWLRENLDYERFEHSLGVADTAVELAERFNLDKDKAYTAGLMHDCAKCLPKSEQTKIMSEHLEVEECEMINPKTFHAPVGAYFAKERFGIVDNEILSAIRWHTIGKLNMTDFEKVIFIADKIEPSRPQEYIDAIKPKLDEPNGLDMALLECYKGTIRSLVDRELKIWHIKEAGAFVR